tara:strand:- start:612 stop:998 length:387 start_codon:yes stop_codon:yes gene_type:complete
MLSDRGLKIKGELVKSFIISGKTEIIPSNDILESQAQLIDEDLNPNILSEHLKLLFKLSRPTSWFPALTELERAYKSDKFKKEFPRKAFVSDNLMITLPLSQDKQEEFEKSRNKLAGFDWRKKNDKII